MASKEETKGFLHGCSIDTMPTGAALRRFHAMFVAPLEAEVAELTAALKKATKKATAKGGK